MGLASDIVFFDQICALATIESRHNIQRRIVESYGSMEISSRVKWGYLSPNVAAHIINLTLIHWFTGQWATDRVYLRTVSIHEDRGKCVRSSLKYHISSLDQTFVNELIAVLCRFARLATTGQENTAFFILNRHKVGRNFDVHDVWAITMRLEVVHEQVVSVVNEEV